MATDRMAVLSRTQSIDTRNSILNTHNWRPKPRHSDLTTQNPTLGAQNSVLNTQDSILKIQEFSEDSSELSPRNSSEL